MPGRCNAVVWYLQKKKNTMTQITYNRDQSIIGCHRISKSLSLQDDSKTKELGKKPIRQNSIGR